MWDSVVDFFTSLTWDSPLVQTVIQVAVLLIFIYVINKVILFSMKKYLTLSERRHGGTEKRSKTLMRLIRSTLRYFSVPIFIIFALPIFGIDPSTVFASAGLLGIVVGFAFQDLLKDIVAGFFIIVERTYELGDMVTINSFTGTVTNLGVKTTRLTAYGGEVYTFNNRDVASVINVSQAEASVVINRIGVAYDTDLTQLAHAIATKIPQWQAKYPEIVGTPSWKGMVEIGDSALFFEVHTKVKPLTQFQFRRAMNTEMVELCREYGFEIPYHMVTLDAKEGK